MWFFLALGSSVFAALTSILAKVGISGVESNLGTAIRTGVVLVLAWMIVFSKGKHKQIKTIDNKELLFIGLSGIATGASWLCYYYAVQNGIQLFDHADIYGNGQSEEIFGQAMENDSTLKREAMILQSKCGIRPGVCYDLSKDYILQSVDGILQRLNTEYLDILLLHRPDALVEPEEVAEAFDKLEKSGKVRKYVTDFPNPTTAGQKGCIVIPHLGASTEESEDNCAKMAVKEMMSYLADGNIKNSVNYPNCDMGVCTKAGRIAIFHKNIANMLTQFTGCFGECGINISDMTNKSRGEVAYTMLDVEQPVTDEIVAKLSAIEGVFKVRVVK